jgi:hypothetical protein
MKRVQRFSTGILFLLLGAMVPAYAQHEKIGDNVIPPPPWVRKPTAKGPQGPHRPQAGAQPERHQQTPRPQQPAPRPFAQAPQRHQGPPPRTVWREHRAQSWQSEHRNWQERGGYHGYRIPEPRFRSHFGPRHVFRIHRYPMSMMGGFINFQFGGFGFSILDPLPEYWSEGWYENDDVYIDDAGDGYYLRNRRHPQDSIAISVTVR